MNCRRIRAYLISTFLLLPWAHPADAQFYYFGRNKVQYTDFAWEVLKTEHFDIYYYPEMKDLAERGAFFAEESYSALEMKFNHTLASRVPLIFYSTHLHFQQTNTIGGFLPEGVGGFFEYMKGRVVIPFDGSIAQFRHVIRHELVHVFTTSKVFRVLADHRRPQDTFPPLWFAEGLAEYWSSDWDTQAEMVMRDVVLNDIVVGLSDMDRIYGSYLMYKEGQDALRFVSSTYGEEKILRLLENIWKDASFNNIFKITIGKNYREFDEEWLYALKKRYYPLLATHDAPSRVTRNLVNEGFNFKPVILERDSLREVYFMSNRTGYTGIYKRQLDDPRPENAGTPVVEGEKTDELEAFHPFRNKIDISRRGILAFVTKSGETDALHLYDITSGKIVGTHRFKNIIALGSTSWSPDGRRLAFSGIDSGGNADLYILDTETGELERLTDDYYDDRDPAWDPRGDRIVFSSDRTPFGSNGKYNLFLYDLPTGGLSYLTYGDDNYAGPAWSKDGTKLAFTADIDGVQNIWVTSFPDSVQTAGPRVMKKITHFVTSAFDPAWTSGGDLVFAAFEKFSFQLKMIPNALASLDTVRTVRPIVIADKDRPWVAQSIVGRSEVKRFRYEGDYSLDVAQSAVSTSPVFGTTGGAFFSLSDLLGDDQYNFLIYNTAQASSELLSSWNIAISRVSLRQRTSYAYGIYRFSGPRYDITAREEYYYERVYGGFLALSFPLSKFQRIETSVSLSNSNKEIDIGIETRKSLLLSNALTFVHDNSLWTSSGPIDGRRYLLTLAYTTDIQYSNTNYYSIILDLRNYVRVGLRSALATRAWLFYNDGKDSRRFVMGGSWDLRGYPRWSIRGEKLWLFSNELRFPFIDRFAIVFPFGGVTFSEIRGALFLDTGGAWDKTYTQTLGSFGGGLRMNFGGVLVLRYDVGKLMLDNLSHLSQGWFQQFFFGWDF